MFFKGKIKIELDNNFEEHFLMQEAEKYVDSLTKKFNSAKKDLKVYFYFKKNGFANRNNYTDSFDDVINSILNENNNANNNYKNKKKGANAVFYFEYCVKSFKSYINEIYVREKINDFITTVNISIANCKKVKILKHDIKAEKAIDAFDELVYNNPGALKDLYKGIINEQDIQILSETFATLGIKKKEIQDTKYNKETILEKNKYICKNEKIKEEIDRIFSVGNNLNIQGLHYLFNENDFDLRQNMYKVIASALYANGRLDNPYYYIVEIDINDKNIKSNFLYLRTRLKISRNDVYFFEFAKKSEPLNNNNFVFDSDGNSFNSENRKFFDTLRENQFVNTFGIYADEEAKVNCTSLLEDELIENMSFVVFSNLMNKEAQLLYAKNKLKRLNQMDMYNAMVEVIEYQNTQVDGLSSNELDDFIISVLKSKYEKVYRPVYKNITKDMTNGNMTKKLMGMVGFKNLKTAVSEMCNKVNFKNIKEDLVPVTKILSQMANYERNNWILAGVPGTGKSTAAEILEKVMYQEKIIKRDIIVKYTPSKNDDECMMTPFGPINFNTSNDLRDSFSQSMGGVLIIDEIGHLSKEDKSLLLQLMEDYKREVCVILCGYENEAESLLNYNPGFRSRFTHIVKMEEYTEDELLQILIQKLKEKHFRVSESALRQLKNIIVTVREVPNFGQARFMESMSDKLIAIHSNNKLKIVEKMINEDSSKSFDEKEIYEIGEVDVENLPLDDMLGEDYKLAKNHKDAYSELHNLIGCSQVKKAVEEFVAKSQIDKIKIDRNLVENANFNMNMIFYGSPGTAKTTVARLVARIMYDKGLINKPKIKEVGAADLVAAYVGQTALKTTAVFKEAKGGVLFIDEAYSLANSDAGGYNQEAIDTIIKEMENNRSTTMVIFAGYKDKMEEFIKCNPGFKSRISKFVDFPNYSIEELSQIFKKQCKDAGYSLYAEDEEKIIKKITSYLSKIINDKQFGNGRECRTIFENAVNMQSIRLIGKTDLSNEDLMTLKYGDFDFLDNDSDFKVEKNNSIGFKVG
ncbi:MAG: AAA family ATPase [Lachnospiraceae bacterium]|nr:AAA family ATPase [Lachnospiraceae bacterium]